MSRCIAGSTSPRWFGGCGMAPNAIKRGDDHDETPEGRAQVIEVAERLDIRLAAEVLAADHLGVVVLEVLIPSFLADPRARGFERVGFAGKVE